MAGTVTLVSAALAVLLSPWFLVLTAFVGVSQWSYVLLHDCPASLVLKNGFGLCQVVYPEDDSAAPHATSNEAVAR